MKKLIAMFLAVLVVFSLTACGAAESPPAKIERKAASASTAAPVQSTPIPEDGLESDGLLHVYLVGDGEKVRTPYSTFIDYITYYEDCGHLIICMNGKDYVFANVSEATWNDFKDAESKGEFYNSTFKGETKYHVNDYDGSNGGLIVLEYVD